MTREEIEREDAFFQQLADEFNAKDASELDNEGVISLAEAILAEIRLEIKHVLIAHRISPDNKEVKRAMKNLDNLLKSDYFNILTMGHGSAVYEYFRQKCSNEAEVMDVG